MSLRIKETVDLLAKASGNKPIFAKKSKSLEPKFEVLLELQNDAKTRVKRILSTSVNAGQVRKDTESGTMAKVLQVIRLQ